MFMALSQPKVVHAELKLPQGQLEHPGFLVQFQATLVVADYRKAGDAGWSGRYYGPNTISRGGYFQKHSRSWKKVDAWDLFAKVRQ